MAWATSGICDPTFAHLRSGSHETEVPTAPPSIHKATEAPVLPKQGLLQKAILVNTSSNDAPMIPALTDCYDPLVSVQKYK